MRRYLLLVVLLIAAPAHAQGDFLQLGQDRLYFEVSGEGDPLVLVSGGSGMDLRQWHKVVPLLAQTNRVIRYDPRGLGKSDNPTERYSDTADLLELLDHLEISSAYLVGLSSSGGFVLEFALNHPERVNEVVAFTPFVPGYPFSESMQERVDRFGQAAQKGKDIFLDAMLSDPYFVADPAERPYVRSVMGFNYDKRAGFNPELPERINPPLIEQLERIKVPILLVAGDLDHSDVHERNRFIAARVPNATVKTIVGAGHNPQLETPHKFVDAVRQVIGTRSLAIDQVSELQRVRRRGDLEKAESMALALMEDPTTTDEHRHHLRLELARIYDRMALHDRTRPSAKALAQLEAVNENEGGLTDETAAVLSLANARYHYRAEMPGPEFSRARQFTQEAIDAYTALGDTYGQAESVHLMGLIEMQARNLPEAGRLFDESLRLDQLAGARTFFRGEYDRHMGFVVYLEGRVEESLPYFRGSVAARKETGALDPLIFAKVTLASVLEELGQDEESREVALDAMASAKAMNSMVAQSRAQTVLDRLEQSDKSQ